MDPNLLRECAQHLLETADFIRGTNWTTAVTSTTQTTTTTSSSAPVMQQTEQTMQTRPNSATNRDTDSLATDRQLRYELLEILMQIVGEYAARPIQTQP